MLCNLLYLHQRIATCYLNESFALYYRFISGTMHCYYCY